MAIPVSAARRSSFGKKHALWLLFGLMTLFVIYQRDIALLDSHSFLRQRYAPIPWLMFLHGIPGAVALVLGVFQFSTRLRQRYRKLHRVLGRIYVGCVLVSAPVAVAVAVNLPVPTLLSASIIQSTGWIVTTLTGLYCIRTGRVQQHREWMVRSYPFAAVFVVARVIQAIPAVERAGLMGIVESVWGVIAVACFLPSFVLAWQSMPAGKRGATTKVRTATAQS